MTGFAFIVTGAVASDIHWLVLARNLKVACPGDAPNTVPSVFTVAIELLLLVQIPPVVGDKVVVAPAHIVAGPVTETKGLGLIVIY